MGTVWRVAMTLVWLATSSPALAQTENAEVDRLSAIPDADKTTAKLRVASGDQKFRAGDYAGALEDYKAADSIMGVPTTSFEVGRTLILLEHYREGRAALERVIAYPARSDEPEAFRSARQRAAAALEDLATKVPTVIVRVRFSKGSSDATDITLDGRSIAIGLPTEVDPGEHRITARAPGFRDDERILRVSSATHPEVVITLEAIAGDEPAPTPRPPVPEPPVEGSGAWPMVMWVGVAVAGAGVIVGSVMGGLSLSKASDFEAEQRADGSYPETARGMQEDTLVLAHASTAAFAVAGAGAALALVGLVMTLNSDGSAEAALGPGALSLRGRF